MTLARSARVLLALAAFAALSLAALDRPGSAQSAVETGWWWKGNAGASVPVEEVPVPPLPAPLPSAPPPPNVGNGLMVAASPDGAVSIAAVRAPVDASSLTLKLAPDGNVGGATAKLLACLPASPWTANKGGRWDDKPMVACDLGNGGGSVAGIPSSDGKAFTFPVLPLVIAGAIDVVIVPAADPATPAGLVAPFQLVFEAPDLSAFQINPPAAPAEETFDPAGDGSASATPGGAISEEFGAEQLVGSETFAPVASAALPPAAQAPRVLTPAATLGANGASTAQAIAVMLLLAVGALAWFASRQPIPAVASLSRVAARTRIAPPSTPTEGGLGRFSRTRSGKPPSLF